MAIEYKEPIRSEYDSEIEYATALLNAVTEYRKAMFQAIDRSASRGTIRIEAVPRKAVDTVHDYLASHPSLIARYKEIGPLALLELD